MSFYIDILVQDKVIVEVKATEKEHSIYQVQLLTYLSLTGLKLGLLVNFGREYVKDGISQLVEPFPLCLFDDPRKSFRRSYPIAPHPYLS